MYRSRFQERHGARKPGKLACTVSRVRVYNLDVELLLSIVAIGLVLTIGGMVVVLMFGEDW